MRRWVWLCAALLMLAACTSPDSDCPAETAAPTEVAAPSADARWDPKFDDLVGFDYGEAWLTPYFVYGTNLALPGAAMLWLALSFLLLTRRRAMARDAEKDAKANELKPGDTMLHGTVVDPDGEGPTVKLTIEQAGVQTGSGKSGNQTRYKTRWTEIDRKLDVRPFMLETAVGKVRVEPDDGTFLIDDLETLPREGPLRKRFAELSDGDTLFAMGTLVELADAKSGGYRAGGRIWVLQPPSNGHMMLSTKPLETAHASRVRSRVVSFIAIGLLVLLAQLLAIPYHFAVFAGTQDEAAVVTARCDYIRGTSESKTHYHYAKYRLLSSNHKSEARVNETDYARMPIGTVIPVNVLRGAGEPRITLGPGVTTNAGVSLVPLLLIVIALIVFPLLISRTRPWWERDKLVDVVSGTVDSQP